MATCISWAICQNVPREEPRPDLAEEGGSRRGGGALRYWGVGGQSPQEVVGDNKGKMGVGSSQHSPPPLGFPGVLGVAVGRGATTLMVAEPKQLLGTASEGHLCWHHA